MAHYRGAEMVSPGVTAVIDIGGQDMKYLAITDGVIDSIAVNEAWWTSVRVAPCS